MAPPRRILRQQLEMLIDFFGRHKDMSKGPPGPPKSHQIMRQNWASLSKQLNSVQSGALKTPNEWKKYWSQWLHKCKRKAERFQSAADGGSNREPLNDLEIRAFELSGNGSVTSAPSTSKQSDNFLDEDSDSEPLDVKMRMTIPKTTIKTSIISTDDDNQSLTPPPKWALDLEERRIAAEERLAEALESIATVMRAQEDRRRSLDERIADTLTAVAGSVRDINSGIQEAVQQLHQAHSLHSGANIKNVYL